MILKKCIIEQLSQKLSLSYTGVEQDWEIEMADSSRIQEFLEFYKCNKLSSDEKMAIISLILASYEDFLIENDLKIDPKWNEIKYILESQKTIFIDLINYWSLPCEIDEDNLFRITPLLRNIK